MSTAIWSVQGTASVPSRAELKWTSQIPLKYPQAIEYLRSATEKEHKRCRTRTACDFELMMPKPLLFLMGKWEFIPLWLQPHAHPPSFEREMSENKRKIYIGHQESMIWRLIYDPSLLALTQRKKKPQRWSEEKKKPAKKTSAAHTEVTAEAYIPNEKCHRG